MQRAALEPESAGGLRDVALGALILTWLLLFQTPLATPAINGANVRAERDEAGRVVSTTPCHGGWRTDEADDCLAPVQERAWSSPIFVDQARGGLR